MDLFVACYTDDHGKVFIAGTYDTYKKAENRIKELGYFDDCDYAEIRVYELNKDYCFNCAKEFYTFESE